MSEMDVETGRRDLLGRVRQPAAPAAGSAGPPLTEMVAELADTRRALQALAAQARMEARERYVTGSAQGQTDTNGDLAVRLFEVPQGATGHLMLAAVDFAGATLASPVTSANLWHALYAGQQGASATAAQVTSVGNMLDGQPLSPAVDAQLPYVYAYGDRWGAPTLVGPGAFWLVVDAATASRQVAVRFGVLLVQPEP